MNEDSRISAPKCWSRDFNSFIMEEPVVRGSSDVRCDRIELIKLFEGELVVLFCRSVSAPAVVVLIEAGSSW